MKTSRHSKRNVFLNILFLSEIKHTVEYSDRYFKEHPYKNCFYGLSRMLSEYGVNNVGVKINNKKKDLLNIETPFIAQLGETFVAVYKVTEDKVYYLWEDLDTFADFNGFCNDWSGYALLVEKTSESSEPNYVNNKKTNDINLLLSALLKFNFLAIPLYVLFYEQKLVDIFILLNIFLNLIGVYICHLILMKKMHIYNKYADKVCSLLKQQDCNDVLESNTLNILGLIGLGEIGLGYFISNIIIILFFPQLVNCIVYINICALPFTFWSIWHQKVKAKQWCILCLSVVLLLWSMLMINSFYITINMEDFGLNIIVTSFIYLLFMISSNTLSNKVLLLKSKIEIEYELNSIKSNENVFHVLLKDRPHYAVDKSNSSILFGNRDSPILVTILTNPHCNPCARMHERVEKLLSETNNLCIQYIFSSFNEELENSNKHLIGVYLNNEKSISIAIFNEWFKYGKLNTDFFKKKYPIAQGLENSVECELQKQKHWKLTTKLQTTPTILVNGYLIPENYKIEDLRYFAENLFDNIICNHITNCK